MAAIHNGEFKQMRFASHLTVALHGVRLRLIWGAGLSRSASGFWRLAICFS